jgi:hypothetical protein
VFESQRILGGRAFVGYFADFRKGWIHNSRGILL